MQLLAQMLTQLCCSVRDSWLLMQTLMLAQLWVELLCKSTYGANLAGKESFMICFCSFLQLDKFPSSLLQRKQQSGRDRLGIRAEGEENWLEHSLRNARLVISPSRTALFSDAGYSDYPVWHFRRFPFSESINHSPSERNEAQGKVLQIGQNHPLLLKVRFLKFNWYFLLQEIIFVDWDIHPLKHLNFFLDEYRCLCGMNTMLFCPKDC